MTIRTAILIALLVRYTAKRWPMRRRDVLIYNSVFHADKDAPGLMIKGAR